MMKVTANSFLRKRLARRFLPALTISTAFILSLASPAITHAQLNIPGLGRPQIPGIKIPGFETLFKEEEPVTTSIKDARGEIPYLDGYEPKAFQPLISLKQGLNGGWRVPPGKYGGDIRTYCLHAGTYGPTRGNGYLYAPLKGKRSDIIQKILHNSASHTDLQQHDIQSLIWAIEARAKFSALPADLQRVAATLLSEKDILALNGMSVNFVTAAAKDRVFGKLSDTLRPIYEAQNSLRGVFSQATAPFDQLERVAVLTGEPPKDRNSRDVPSGRWSLHPSGIFVRYLPANYSRTTLQICVPGRFDIKRDSKGRIVSIYDSSGNGVETDYNDTIAPLTTTVKTFQGYDFASIRFVTANASLAGGKSVREHKNVGWTFTGIPAGKNIRVGSAASYPGCEARLQTAVEFSDQLDNFKKHCGKRTIPWGVPVDVIDLAQYRSGIESALKTEGAPETESFEILIDAWQFALCQWACDPQANAGDPSGVIDFDPSDDVAVPCESGRQRLGQSTVPFDLPGR